MQTDDNSRLDFLRAQVLTSRNIRGSWWADIICRSLNYQIEHHLFPTMPRNRMTQANKIVREYCEQAGVAYHDTSMLRSDGELLGFLHNIGAGTSSIQVSGRPTLTTCRALRRGLLALLYSIVRSFLGPRSAPAHVASEHGRRHSRPGWALRSLVAHPPIQPGCVIKRRAACNGTGSSPCVRVADGGRTGAG